MNSELENIFPDTDTFLSHEEENILKETREEFIPKDEIGNVSMTPKRKIQYELVKKGHLAIFQTAYEDYIYNPHDINAIPVSVDFNAYFAKLSKMHTDNGEATVLTTEEQNKIKKFRGFIAVWIFKKKEITKEQFLKFLSAFTSRLTYSLSFPEFLTDKFIDAIEGTGIEYRIITPEQSTGHCPYCQCDFRSMVKDMVPCPKCGEQVLIRS